MHNFDLCKVVSFHSRVKWASSFADSFPWAVGLMPRAMRPTGNLWCRHVSGSQTAKDRNTELTALKNLDATTHGLLANARCLTEGVDVPALDGVAFIDHRRSEVDVVQAVGRAIRKARDKKVGTVVIPVFVGRRSDAVAALETSAFKPVWQVIQALRAHDDVLASQLDELRREKGRRGTTGKLPSKIKLIGAIELGSGFLAAFDARLVEQTTTTWEFWFGLLEAFVAREGSARINNILAVLSKALKYSVDCELITKSPKIGLYKVERPEIEPRDFERYARMLKAAKLEGATGMRPCVSPVRRDCAALKSKRCAGARTSI